MERFVDDDFAYLSWTAGHPSGYVINTYRNPSAAYLVLHRTSCRTITGTPANGSTFTRVYAKVCGSRNELEEFAAKLGGSLRLCGLCMAQRSSVPVTGYVDFRVITAIKACDWPDRFDRGKLLKLIDELNYNIANGGVYAAHAVLRALLDHIPPLFGYSNFTAVANNYPWSQTDKAYMRKLLDFKLQADDALHRRISPKFDLLTVDDLPRRIWVNRLLQECASPRLTSKYEELPAGLKQRPSEAARSHAVRGQVQEPASHQKRPCFHPPQYEEHRSAVPAEPCQFQIDPDWENKRDKNWTMYGDVRVTVQGVRDRTYLIPSGASPQIIYDPARWQHGGLIRKKTLTAEWCAENVGSFLEGFLFQMTRRDGSSVPRIYCAAYDNFLREGVLREKRRGGAD